MYFCRVLRLCYLVVGAVRAQRVLAEPTVMYVKRRLAELDTCCVYFHHELRLCCPVRGRFVLWVIGLRFVLVKHRCVQSLVERLNRGGQSEVLDLVLRSSFYYWCTGILCCPLQSTWHSQAYVHLASVVEPWRAR